MKATAKSRRGIVRTVKAEMTQNEAFILLKALTVYGFNDDTPEDDSECALAMIRAIDDAVAKAMSGDSEPEAVVPIEVLLEHIERGGTD